MRARMYSLSPTGVEILHSKTERCDNTSGKVIDCHGHFRHIAFESEISHPIHRLDVDIFLCWVQHFGLLVERISTKILKQSHCKNQSGSNKHSESNVALLEVCSPEQCISVVVGCVGVSVRMCARAHALYLLLVTAKFKTVCGFLLI